MGNKGFIQAQHSSFPHHIVSVQVQTSMRSGGGSVVKSSLFLTQLKLVHVWLLTLKGL